MQRDDKLVIGLIGDYHNGLTDVAMDANGYLYTISPDPSEPPIKVRDPEGWVIRQFGELGSEPGQLSAPWGIAVDESGHIIVADTGNDCIQAFDNFGNFIAIYGDSGSGGGQFNEPKDVVVDADGHIIVADTGNNRLQILAFNGENFTYLRSIYADLDSPSAVTIDSVRRIIVADSGNNKVKMLDWEGNILAEWDGPNDGYTGRFNRPQGVAVDKGGRIIVSDTGNLRVVTIVSGIPPQPTPTPTPTETPTPTPTPIGTPTATPTAILYRLYLPLIMKQGLSI
jgi:hypothetical protein